MSGFIPSQRRADRQIALGHVRHGQSAPFGSDLSQQALSRTETRRNRRIGRNTERGDAPKYAALSLEKGGRLNIGISRQIGENAVRQLLDRLITHHGVRQTDLALVNPLLTSSLTDAAPDEGVDGQGQGGAQKARQNPADQSCPIGRVHFHQASEAELLLLLPHEAHPGPDGVHLRLAAIRIHSRQGGLHAFAATRLNRGVQFGHLGVDVPANLPKVILLGRIVAGQACDVFQTTRHGGGGQIVRLQVEGVAGKQIAALACLRVLHGRKEFIDGDDHLVRVDNLLIIVSEHLDVEPGDSACREEEGKHQTHAGCGPGFGLRARRRATERHHQQSDLGERRNPPCLEIAALNAITCAGFSRIARGLDPGARLQRSGRLRLSRRLTQYARADGRR
ncbi:hypothetical protein D3C72_344320 [compost metagenome]